MSQPPKNPPLAISGLDSPDKMSYAKADFTSIVRSGNNFALSFYQIDYHFHVGLLAKSGGGNSPVSVSKDSGIINPVAKVVLDYEGFMKLKQEIETLLAKYEEQKKQGLS